VLFPGVPHPLKSRWRRSPYRIYERTKFNDLETVDLIHEENNIICFSLRREKEGGGQGYREQERFIIKPAPLSEPRHKSSS
jgi:hypothetical protein